MMTIHRTPVIRDPGSLWALFARPASAIRREIIEVRAYAYFSFFTRIHYGDFARTSVTQSD